MRSSRSSERGEFLLRPRPRPGACWSSARWWSLGLLLLTLTSLDDFRWSRRGSRRPQHWWPKERVPHTGLVPEEPWGGGCPHLPWTHTPTPPPKSDNNYYMELCKLFYLPLLWPTSGVPQPRERMYVCFDVCMYSFFKAQNIYVRPYNQLTDIHNCTLMKPPSLEPVTYQPINMSCFPVIRQTMSELCDCVWLNCCVKVWVSCDSLWELRWPNHGAWWCTWAISWAAAKLLLWITTLLIAGITLLRHRFLDPDTHIYDIHKCTHAHMYAHKHYTHTHYCRHTAHTHALYSIAGTLSTDTHIRE